MFICVKNCLWKGIVLNLFYFEVLEVYYFFFILIDLLLKWLIDVKKLNCYVNFDGVLKFKWW